jgi:hypothetical protein
MRMMAIGAGGKMMLGVRRASTGGAQLVTAACISFRTWPDRCANFLLNLGLQLSLAPFSKSSHHIVGDAWALNLMLFLRYTNSLRT